MVEIKNNAATKTLGEIGVEFLKGKGLSKSHLSIEGSHYGIHYGQLFTEYGAVIEEPLNKVNDFLGSFKSKTNDVLMPTSDVTPNGLARASSLLLDDVVLGGDILVIRAKPLSVYGPFLSYVIRNSVNQIKSLVSGTTVYHIYGKDMSKFSLSLPSYEEQIEIVQALGEIDELILCTKNELEKKRNLYDGVYYELFKKAGLWKKKTISELGSLSTSSRKQSNGNPESNFVILDMGSIDEIGRVIESKFTNISDDLLPKGTIVIPKDDIGGGKIIGKGFCVSSDNRFVLGDHVFALSVFKDNPFFVRYALNFTTSNQEILRIVAGSAQLGLPKRSFLKHSLPIPDIAEQDEIASILFEMENELSKLIRNLQKYEWLKQGMMNDLLTGKVRLV